MTQRRLPWRASDTANTDDLVARRPYARRASTPHSPDHRRVLNSWTPPDAQAEALASHAGAPSFRSIRRPISLPTRDLHARTSAIPERAKPTGGLPTVRRLSRDERLRPATARCPSPGAGHVVRATPANTAAPLINSEASMLSPAWPTPDAGPPRLQVHEDGRAAGPYGLHRGAVLAVPGPGVADCLGGGRLPRPSWAPSRASGGTRVWKAMTVPAKPAPEPRSRRFSPRVSCDTPEIMADHVLERRVWLPRPRAEVFAFFADARNLALVNSPTGRLRWLTPPPPTLAAGAVIDFSIRAGGLPLPWPMCRCGGPSRAGSIAIGSSKGRRQRERADRWAPGWRIA